MEQLDNRYVLAFDGSCETCQVMSEAVARACAGKLEVLPLGHPDVDAWRRAALGDDAPWTPTLIRQGRGRTRAWTGAAMAVPLVRRLGPRSTVRVLKALGQLAHQYNGHPLESASVGRKQFLRLAAGTAVAAGLVLGGQAPAFAEKARDWVDRNEDGIPRTYAGIVAYPMTYRRAIHARLTPRERSGVWQDHLAAYRAGHHDLTAAQGQVLDQLEAEVSDVSVFERSGRYEPPRELRDAAVAAFGPDGTRAVVGTLGPVEAGVAAVPAGGGCVCHQEDGFCDLGYHCRPADCATTSSGCGWWYGQTCDGLCYD